MARQFREQLEEEVEIEQARKAQRPSPASAPEAPPKETAPHEPTSAATAPHEPTPRETPSADERRT
jgi:hypothetical protein